ncbi:hypothetical protein EJ063_16380 [Vibrio aquaticus]|uniref:Protein kinase domain-containing protein n=1 Tax=Vibrio aquaticus TaxID=2496559 RepID=A0A432CW54_9VIBR|nr:protein kinase [Vibrio aquaticus]RTZ14491.1 hypothetical protein EJ063_16380 [Vibrio aquaticus]
MARIAEQLTPERRYAAIIEQLGLTVCSELSTNVLHCHGNDVGNVTLKVAHTKIGHAQLANEIEFLKRHASPYWPTYIQSGRNNNQMWLLTQFQKGSPLTEPKVWNLNQNCVLRAFESALYSLHQTGYIHGDVKPANLLLTPDGKARLIDMGSVLPIGERYDQQMYSSISPMFSSPKAHLRQGRISPVEDYFSFGVSIHSIFYEHPFNFQNTLDFFKQGRTPVTQGLPARYQYIISSTFKTLPLLKTVSSQP